MFNVKRNFYLLSALCIFAYIYLVADIVAENYSKAFPPVSHQTPESYTQSHSESYTESSLPLSASSEINVVQNNVVNDQYAKKLYVYKNSILPYNEHKTSDYIQETLFIGDSNTEGLYAYGYLPLQSVLGKRSMAIQEVLTNRYVWFKGFESPLTAVEAAKLLCPRRIIINFGTNNAAGTSTDSFISEYKTVIEHLSEACPDSDIIVAAVLPVSYYRENYNIKQSTIDGFNIALAKLCSEMGYKFLDYSEAFRNPDNGYMYKSCVASDGIHLTQKGYKMLLEYIDNHQFVTNDTRPEKAYIPIRCEYKQSLQAEDAAAVPDGAENDVTPDSSSSEEHNSSKNLSDSSDLDNINSEKIIYDPFL